jgi:hypothetical protein
MSTTNFLQQLDLLKWRHIPEGVLQGDAANANLSLARYACTPDNQIQSEKGKILLNNGAATN